MGRTSDVDTIFHCLQQNIGTRSVARDRHEGCVYLEAGGQMPAGGRMPMVHKLNAERGTAHCYADLSAVLTGAELGPVLELANQINISIARDLGVPVSVHVIDDRLHLSDIRPIMDGRQAHRLCAEQARDLIEIAGTLARELRCGAPDHGADFAMIRL